MPSKLTQLSWTSAEENTSGLGGLHGGLLSVNAILMETDDRPSTLAPSTSLYVRPSLFITENVTVFSGHASNTLI